MIEVKSLSRHYGHLKAVDDLSFTVEPGQVLGFLGPNGAGKSTTMKMLTGFLAPTAGSARVNGHDVVTDSLAARLPRSHTALYSRSRRATRDGWREPRKRHT